MVYQTLLLIYTNTTERNYCRSVLHMELLRVFNAVFSGRILHCEIRKCDILCLLVESYFFSVPRLWKKLTQFYFSGRKQSGKLLAIKHLHITLRSIGVVLQWFQSHPPDRKFTLHQVKDNSKITFNSFRTTRNSYMPRSTNQTSS